MKHSYKSACVIGSGFGGLAAAIRLQARGIPTTILERSDRLGGRAGSFSRDGFTFDMGPTVITAPHCLADLFTLAGRSPEKYYELLPVSPMYRLKWSDGNVFDYHRDGGSLMQEIARLSPQDARRYPDFFRYTHEVFRKGYLELGDKAFLQFHDMIKAAPDLIRLRAYRSVYSEVSRFFKNEKIRQAFSFNALLIGGHPFKASAIYSLIHALEREWGVYYPRGGITAMIQALATLFRDIGGRIVTGVTVDRIVTEKSKVKGVETQADEHVPSEIVVCNSDVTKTYTDLLREEPRASRSARRLKAMNHSPSLFVVYFGTNRKFDDLKQHTVIFADRYRELVDDIFEGPGLPRDASVYLHVATRTDPALAPPGGEACYALAPVPHLGKSPVDWDRLKEAYADKILKIVEAHAMPGLNASLVCRDTFTPVDFRDKLLSHHGSAFSLEPTLTQSAYFRVKNRDPLIPGLYFVGAGTHPGAGIPGVVASAKATADLIYSDCGLKAEPTEAPAFAGAGAGTGSHA